MKKKNKYINFRASFLFSFDLRLFGLLQWWFDMSFSLFHGLEFSRIECHNFWVSWTSSSAFFRRFFPPCFVIFLVLCLLYFFYGFFSSNQLAYNFFTLLKSSFLFLWCESKTILSSIFYRNVWITFLVIFFKFLHLTFSINFFHWTLPLSFS